VLIVDAHEEPHAVSVPDNLALDKLAAIAAEEHRMWIHFGTATSSFLDLRNSKSNSGSK
jgi:hypothetical protein